MNDGIFGSVTFLERVNSKQYIWAKLCCSKSCIDMTAVGLQG